MKDEKKIRDILALNGSTWYTWTCCRWRLFDEFPNLPKILVNHNVESVRLRRWFETESNPLKKLFLGYQWLKLRAFERDAMNRLNCCVTVSETDRELLRGWEWQNPWWWCPTARIRPPSIPSGKPVTPKYRALVRPHGCAYHQDAVLYFWNDIYPVLRERRPDVSVSFVGTSPARRDYRGAPMHIPLIESQPGV